MKCLKIILILSLSIGASHISHADGDKKKKETFKVWGQCEMCHDKITKTVKSVDGVKSVSWNVVTKMMKVKFDENITSLDSIQIKISKAGYDTEKYKASDETYNNLHHCCKYNRN
jgi:periplasmic mercuric ion binding protein